MKYLILVALVCGTTHCSPLADYLTALGGSSLLETHIETAATSKKKRPEKVTDLDCDSVRNTIDMIEQTCHEYRYRQLLTLAPVIETLVNNKSTLISKLADLNVTLNGYALEEGLLQKIAYQSAALYTGIPAKRVPSLTHQSDVLTRNVFKLFDIMNGVYDTEWSNFLTTTSVLGKYIADFNIDTFVSQLNKGMFDAQLAQTDMMNVFRAKANYILSIGNTQLGSNTKLVNDFQKWFGPAIQEIPIKHSELHKAQIASANAASDKLDDTTDYLDTVPQAYQDANTKYRTDGMNFIRAGRDAFLANATLEGLGAATKNWKREDAMFDQSAAASIAQESKAWAQAEAVRVASFGGTFKTFSQKNADAISSQRLSDAREMGVLNEMVNNMTEVADESIFKAKTSIDQSNTQLKKLQQRAAAANTDVAAEFAKLLTTLADGTSDQQAKISNFLKLSADSDANQLAALVQSAVSMRSSLGDGQAGARADLDNLIVSLQTELARKAQSEGTVSLDVQKALALGGSTSQAKINAAKDYQALLNAQAVGGFNDAAGDALDSVMEASMAGATNIANVAGDMQNVAKTSRLFVGDQAALTEAQIKQAVDALRNIAVNQAGATVKSTSDASLAAHDILVSLASVKSGSSSFAQALQARDGSMSNKLSAIASQLGLSDDAASAMYAGLLKTMSASADSQIQAKLAAQLAASKAAAHKVGSSVDKSTLDIDGVAADTAIAQQRAVDVDAAFKAKIGSVAQSLDAQFASRMDRDSAIRSAVQDGLSATNRQLVTEAARAINGLAATRQAYRDSASLQVDRDLAGFNSDVAQLSRTQFNKINSAMGQVSAIAASRESSATDLDKATNGFNSYVDEAHRRIAAESVLLDNEKNFFDSNTSAIWVGSPELANLTQIDALNSNLTAFMKSVPRKISNEMKAIEDAFLLTDSQIATKAHMLQSMASGDLSDSQRLALNSQLANLQKSESLMSNFKEVQRQALNQVFAKNSGLLGVAGGTIGDLGDVANSISTMLNSNDKLNAQIDNTFSATSASAQGMTTEMSNAITGTGDALTRSIVTSNSHDAFSSNITNAQVSALIQSGNRDAILASTVASDVSNVSDIAIAEKQRQLAAYAKMLGDNKEALTRQVTDVMRAANNSDADLQRRVDNDVAEEASQLIIVKNAVEQLLQTWQQYTDAENRKFTRWNSTEAEYLGQYKGSLSSLNQTAMTEVARTSHAIGVNQQLSAHAIADLVGFENKMAASNQQVVHAVLALNTSAASSIAQVGEQIYQQDLMDNNYDAAARLTAQRDVVIATNTADAQMKEIIDSLTLAR